MGAACGRPANEPGDGQTPDTEQKNPTDHKPPPQTLELGQGGAPAKPSSGQSSGTASQGAAQRGAGVLSAAPQTVNVTPGSGGELALRKELRELSPNEQYRLLTAIQRMQSLEVNKRIWQKIAGVHGGGIPKDDDVQLDDREVFWCPHRSQLFPIWHRAYLAEMEYILQEFDVDPDIERAGRHTSAQRIMLPFWDWSRGTKFPQDLPPILTQSDYTLQLTDPSTGKTQTVTFSPNPLFSGPSRTSAEAENDKDRLVRTTRSDPQAILTELYNRDVSDQAQEALAADDYKSFSSAAFSSRSIESPHDGVHVACGDDMSSVNTAAFDPIFWFHHNNVERFWFAWEMEHIAEHKFSLDTEFLGEKLEPFAPWALGSGHIYPWQNARGPYPTVQDWSDSRNLPVNYSYSYMPQPPVPRGLQMRSRGIIVIIRNIPTPPKSADIYVYLRKRVSHDDRINLAVHQNLNAENDGECAGLISLFAFNSQSGDDEKKVTCVNCRSRPPLHYSLDVTKYAVQMKIRNPSQGVVAALAYFVDNGTAWTPPELMANIELCWEEEFHQDEHALQKRHKQYLAYFGYLSSRVTYEQARDSYVNQWKHVLAAQGVDTRSLSNAEMLNQLMKVPRSGNGEGNVDQAIPIITDILAKQVVAAAASAASGSTITVAVELRWRFNNVDAELQSAFASGGNHLADPLVVYCTKNAFAPWTDAVNDWMNNADHLLAASNASGKNVRVRLRLSFGYASDGSSGAADVSIGWRPMDGIGRMIGYTDVENNACVIALDTAEEWKIDSAETISAAASSGSRGGSKEEKKQEVSPAHLFGPLALDSVVVHELGHCFGLGHSEDVHSVMNPYHHKHKRVPAAAEARELLKLVATRIAQISAQRR